MAGNDHYPGIARAALQIALDNGGIHRGRSVDQMKKELHRWLAGQPEEEIQPIDAWLSSLSDEDLSTVCCGERSDVEEVLSAAPPFTDDFLDRYFNEVC